MSKYHNKKTVVDGITFDSTKESRYYLFLKERVAAGEITNLRLQVPYEVIPAVHATRQKVKHLKKGDKIITEEYVKQRATKYIADFVYTDVVTGQDEVIDVKSVITRKKESYRLKKKMMLAFLGIDVIEV